jgi:hypothetical protein
VVEQPHVVVGGECFVHDPQRKHGGAGDDGEGGGDKAASGEVEKKLRGLEDPAEEEDATDAGVKLLHEPAAVEVLEDDRRVTKAHPNAVAHDVDASDGWKEADRLGVAEDAIRIDEGVGTREEAVARSGASDEGLQTGKV